MSKPHRRKTSKPNRGPTRSPGQARADKMTKTGIILIVALVAIGMAASQCG